MMATPLAAAAVPVRRAVRTPFLNRHTATSLSEDGTLPEGRRSHCPVGGRWGALESLCG